MKWIAAFLMLLVTVQNAVAGLTRADIAQVGINLPRGARIDLDLAARDARGGVVTLGTLLRTKPAVLVFADYTCTSLCGPDLKLLSAAIDSADLDPSRYSLIVMGIDPKDTAKAALAMADEEISEPQRSATILLLPDQATVDTATQALGYRYVYDAANDQFAHPAVAYTLAVDGSVTGVFSPFAVQPQEIKAALSDAAPTLTLVDRVRLLCYAYDPISGRYSPSIILFLRLSSAACVAGLAIALLILARRRRRIA